MPARVNDICPITDLDREICKHCHSNEFERTPSGLLVPPSNPGVYDGIPDEVYHGDRASLSSSLARMILRIGGPELVEHARRSGPKHAEHYDVGHAAHALLLGIGLDIVEIHAKDWKTKAAQQARADAYDAGKVPLLSSTVREVEAMVAKARAHPTVAEVLSGGRPEVSAYAIDETTWLMLRARLDYYRPEAPGVVSVVDYKTTTDATQPGFTKSSGLYGYPIQEAFYRYVLRLLGIEVDRFLFVAQEKDPPYRITVNEHQADDVRVAELLVHRAIAVWAECVATGRWPGLSEDIQQIYMPEWRIREWEELAAWEALAA